MTNPVARGETPAFSLALGGPLFRLFVQTRLSGTQLEWAYRRILVLVAVSYLPLLLALTSGPVPGTIQVPFLRDIEVHVRFLVVLPLLIAAELSVNSIIRTTVAQFIDCGIVSETEFPLFDAAVNGAMRARDSLIMEAILLILVCTAGHWIWRSQALVGLSTWYAVPEGSSLRFTYAGYWYAFVSIPIFQFIGLRWLYRIFIWIWFLRKMTKLELRLNPAHADRAAGLGFLGTGTCAFAPVLFAEGAILSATIANHVILAGEKLMSFKLEALGLVVCYLLLILAPLTMFSPLLGAAKWRGQIGYGRLVSRLTQHFDEKWIGHNLPDGERVLGNPDFSSLNNVGVAFVVIRQTSLVPFGLDAVTVLAGSAVAPLLPLALTIFSFDQLVTLVLRMAFR